MFLRGWSEANKNYLMFQCLLECRREHELIREVAWIPAEKVSAGRVNIGGDVYLVSKKYSSDMSESVIANSRDFTRHRKATDV